MKNDEGSIIAVNRDFAEAWSRGDAKATAGYFCEDGVRVGAMGDAQHGRADVEAAYDRMLHGRFAGATVRQEPGTVRMLGTEYALWQGGIEIVPADGGPAIRGHVVELMRKLDGKWWILEAHPKLFPPPLK